MRKLFCILLALLLCPQLIQAQKTFEPEEGCLNIIEVSAGPRIGSSGSGIYSAHYMHERFFTEQLSAGGGIAFGYYNQYAFSSIPVYLSAHYFFLDSPFSPFVNLRVGGFFPLSGNQGGISLYLAPIAGLKMHLSPHFGVLASVGDNAQLIRIFDAGQSSYQRRLIHNLTISVGVCFQIPGW